MSIAYELQRRGKSVTLVDRDEPGRGASFGNMASIAVTEFMPASRPSIWKQIPGWMLDPEGPVRVRPGYMPRLIPWFARFVAASRPSKAAPARGRGAVLCKRVYDDLLPLLRETGLEGNWRKKAAFRFTATKRSSTPTGSISKSSSASTSRIGD
ncbi:FAD-dependent oxidoreductase [Ensifer psoraleae]|uniref:FAD-dependent oxidoreductase n=1 Tax=Sinorhizobium psoraleae TaxID=520838 RepID=A0ABT4KMU6_9HYPH|nr:FAD-dependent oxidoreductase [Sinorhizobium psoraleae]MCZ4093277.1 FAD-dependent oxidoreductase [Sinorhizobium psoraleae]